MWTIYATELTKSLLKKLVKRQIREMMNLVRKAAETIKKLRFTLGKEEDEFCTKPYILKMGGTEAIHRKSDLMPCQ